MSNPYFGKFLIWEVPFGKSHELRTVLAAFPNFEERDAELEKLRDNGERVVYIAQNPDDCDRADARRTL